MSRLDGKTAFITGGARGVGRAIARKFASEGANIVICDIAQGVDSVTYPLASLDDLELTVNQVQSAGGQILAEIADVRDQKALDRVVEKGIARFGAIDIAVANAGVVGFKPFWEITEQEWHEELDVVLAGAWRTAKAVAPHMIQRQDGVIVFVSSSQGIEGGVNYMHYCAAKHGVEGVMKCAALELAPYNIRANAILPGPVHTPISDNPSGRSRIVGREGASREEYFTTVRHWFPLRGRTALPPDAIADGTIWLVSDEARHVTGLELIIDGGHNVLPGVNPTPIIDDVAFGYAPSANDA